jgi:hypothetical protein
MGNGSAVNKRLKSALPNEGDLKALIQLLSTGADEDFVAMQVGDVKESAQDLVVRLERRIREMRAQGEQVPPGLSRMVKRLGAYVEEQAAYAEGEARIDSLLAGQLPPGRTQIAGGASFRSLRMDLLTAEDLEILKEMQEEIRLQKNS